VFGQRACARGGLSAATVTPALQDELKYHNHQVLDLTSRIEELDDELAAPAMPTAGSWPNSTVREHLSNAAMHWHDDLPEAWGTHPKSVPSTTGF
jgi:hypothetical protein